MTLSSRLRFYLPILSGITTTSPDADTLLITLCLMALIVVEEYRASSYYLLLSLYLLVGSSVGIGTGYGLDGLGIECR
jgi:hypothetical protein